MVDRRALVLTLVIACSDDPVVVATPTPPPPPIDNQAHNCTEERIVDEPKRPRRCEPGDLGPCAIFLNESVSESAPEPLLSRENALDAEAFYWANSDTLYRTPKYGLNGPTQVIATAPGNITSVATTKDGVYFTTYESILSVEKKAGAVERIIAKKTSIRPLVSDGVDVFFLDRQYRSAEAGPLYRLTPTLEKIPTDRTCTSFDVDARYLYCRTIGSVYRIEKNGGEGVAIDRDEAPPHESPMIDSTGRYQSFASRTCLTAIKLPCDIKTVCQEVHTAIFVIWRAPL